MKTSDVKRARVQARSARHRAEAVELGLGCGKPHPVSGRVWGGDAFHTPEAWERKRRGHLVRLASYRARECGLLFDLTPEWLNLVWPANGRCPVLPWITLQWGREDIGSSPSIDKIVPSRGYTTDNCRVISQRANALKSNASVEELRCVLLDAEELHR